MANHILLVFEGARSEINLFNNLNKFYINDNNNTILIAVFGTTIYTLYKQVTKESYLDLFTLIKEKSAKDSDICSISRDDVSEIYLFFDYDGHASNASDAKIHEMLNFFNEETDNGKLYISYPMLESLKHLKNNTPFQDTVAESNKNYKKLVNKNCDKCYLNITKLTQADWNVIISEHCKKLNYLINGSFCFPVELIDQVTIYLAQKEKYINPNNQVAVLSAFPVFIADYYGYNNIPSLIGRIS
ncbi:MAG: hypothetical protein KAH22_05010 [Thiotrichaceae bacterium]|nr:hypothetical protein [Thiotrichaceae bacterium]